MILEFTTNVNNSRPNEENHYPQMILVHINKGFPSTIPCERPNRRKGICVFYHFYVGKVRFAHAFQGKSIGIPILIG